MRLVGPRDGHDGGAALHQETVAVSRGLLEGGVGVQRQRPDRRGCRVQVISGSLEIEGERLGRGDRMSIEGPADVPVRGLTGGTDVLVVSLA